MAVCKTKMTLRKSDRAKSYSNIWNRKGPRKRHVSTRFSGNTKPEECFLHEGIMHPFSSLSGCPCEVLSSIAAAWYAMHQDILSNLPRGLKPSGKLKKRQNQVLPIFNALQHAAAYVFLSRNTKQIVSSGVCEQRSQLSLYTQITVQKGENSYALRVTAELLRRHWGISCQYVFVCTAITWGSTPLLPTDESLHTWW